jgi:hypothetical protein
MQRTHQVQLEYSESKVDNAHTISSDFSQQNNNETQINADIKALIPTQVC